MKRQENLPPKPNAGFGSVPLFNQRKWNRVPLTSAPSENEFFFHSEFMASTNPATAASTSSSRGRYWASGANSDASQSSLWKTQDTPSSGPLMHYQSNRAGPGPGPGPGPEPAVRHCAPLLHPYKPGDAGSKLGAHRNPVRGQESSFVSSFRQSGCQPTSSSAQGKLTSHSGFTHTSQRSLGSAFPTHSDQSRPLARPIPHPKGPSVAALPPERSCKVTPSFVSQSEQNRGSGHNQAALPKKVQELRKPALGNSLRILTAVIAGMRHWSQFKDRVPFLVEMFATLDSAVTLGEHGAKNFLMRDGKEVVQCVFYENEQVLPRLIRGQLHRCVGNYDRRRDVLTCVSVRPGLPSELQNAQAAVKVCDAEMRALLKSFNEV